MDELRVASLPELRQPIAVLAYTGWNDAANAASNAAKVVAAQLNAEPFATIDPERFYNFEAAQPSVRRLPNHAAEVIWPATEFLVARGGERPHDVVIGIGVEPDLRWRRYATLHTHLLRSAGIEHVVLLGAVRAAVPHTRPTRIRGNATDPETLSTLNVEPLAYEGPAGIVEVLYRELEAAGFEATTLWAQVPDYLNTSANPPATAALLQRLEKVIEFEFDYRELREASDRFLGQVNRSFRKNRRMIHHVQQLEDALKSPNEAKRETTAPSESRDLLGDVEAFLRRQRPTDR